MSILCADNTFVYPHALSQLCEKIELSGLSGFHHDILSAYFVLLLHIAISYTLHLGFFSVICQLLARFFNITKLNQFGHIAFFQSKNIQKRENDRRF